jgi:purine-binding chemotaxis protein CheW
MIERTVTQDSAAEASADICILRVGAERFGLGTHEVRAVLSGQSPQPVPLAPQFLAGMMSYRGDVLLVASLAAMLGQSVQQEGTVVVLADEKSGECFGLLVNEVEDVMPLTPSSLGQNPPTLDARRMALFHGVYRLERGLVGWLKTEQLRPEAWHEKATAEGWFECEH